MKYHEKIDLADSYINILKEPYKAITLFNSAIKEQPTPELYVKLFNAYALIGEYRWDLYEYRFEFLKDSDSLQPYFKEKRNKWHGEYLNGKRLFVYTEQGLGDNIQFLRFLIPVKELGATIIVQERQELKRLLAEQWYVDEQAENAECDYYISLLSLPYMLQCDFKSEPYITCSNYFELNTLNNIGVHYKGNSGYKFDRLRSIPCFDLPGNVFSLQKEESGCNDLLDTAILINSLDTIVAIDSCVLHLAAAMGKKCYGLIPYIPDWRWGISGSNSLWYKDLELVRQEKDDWGKAIEYVVTKTR